MSAHTIDADVATFNHAVVEESRQRPVLVDFWAPWCAPCRALKPILEKLAEDYAGRFLLVRVNTDENQALAGDFGVRGIPNVKAFSHGEIVDEFTGALPEGVLRQFIERVLPGPAEKQRRDAMQALSAGNAEQALVMLDAAQDLEPDNESIRIDRAEALVALGRTEEATQLLDQLGPVFERDARVERLRARLIFHVPKESAVDAHSLEERASENPGNLHTRLTLAKHYVTARQFEPALEQLLEIVRTDRAFEDDAGRKTMLAVFELLGNDHELTGRYRRKLAAALN